MQFNTFSYIFLFLPVAVVVYFYFNRINEKLGRYWLVLISLTFYCVGALTCLPVLLLSIVVNFFFGRYIYRSHSQSNPGLLSAKTFLVAGIIFNISFLAFYKYYDFIAANINQISSLNVPVLRMLMPVAISFYTFQQISFLIDVYRDEIEEINLLEYLMFIAFFPKMMLGPITRYKELIPQFNLNKKVSLDFRNMSIGIFLLFLGLFKCVVIANTFRIYSDVGFNSNTSLSLIEAWITSFSYTFQIYYDFSGYTDMALGTAYFFNIKIPFNFNSPYLAINMQDFWRRWHMTLSRFLRDYLYIPLGGNRNGTISTVSNIMTTFLIGGLWHGAAWTFIIWGGIHGIATCVNRLWQKMNLKIPRFIAIFITFNVVNIAWVFFRSKDLVCSINILKSMIGVNALSSISIFAGINPTEHFIALIIALISILTCFLANNSNTISSSFQPSNTMVLKLLFMIIVSLLFLNSTDPREFIYNDF